MRRSSFSRSHSKLPLKQQHRLRPPPSSTTALNLGNDVDEEARSDSNLNIDQRVKHLTGMTETDIACMQAEGIANEEDLRNIEFDDLPDSLPVVKRRKLNLVSRYLAAGNELNDTITMIQVQQTVETVIAATSSFVDISFDSASSLVTLIFDGDTDDPVRASASDMMKDQGISEVRAKDNSKPRGISMETLVSNKNMVGGSINFDGQKYTINSSTNAPWELIGDGFRKYLQSVGTSGDEFNILSVMDRLTLRSSFNKERNDLFNFFSQTGRSEERSLYLSNLLKPINRVDLLDYYREYSNKSDFYTDLETRFGVTDNIDKSQIYGALSQYVEKDEQDNKSFADLINNDKRGALEYLRTLAEPLRQTSDFTNVNPSAYCIPYKMNTWNEDVMANQVKDLREKISFYLDNYSVYGREPLVIGIRLGSGCGKTHALVEAGKWLNAELIYIAYNLDQYLDMDRLNPREALLLRLILTVLGFDSFTCGEVFLNYSDICFHPKVTKTQLRELFLHCVKEKYNGDIVISVDEIALLKNVERAKEVISELGKVAFEYKNTTSSMCTALVSSLISENFKTSSGRSVKNWTPPIPDESTIGHMLKDLPESANCNKKAMINVLSTVGGRHMRSLVLARKIMEKDRYFSLNTHHILNQMKNQLGLLLCSVELALIREYVESCITDDKVDGKFLQEYKEIEPYTDSVKAIAPALILMAFQESNSNAKTALFDLFELVASSDNVSKQLENIAKAYDFFRQNLRLPVVPTRAEIYLPANMNNWTVLNWYRGLVFPRNMALCEDSLLRSTGKGGAECIVEAIELGDYFHPNQPNHPWIDRAFLAYHSENSEERCLVLAQDKVNKNDFSKAVNHLNMAADVLSEKCAVKDVLCIANVIGATGDTTAQKKFKYPFILIRNEDEVRNFFSVNFTPIVMFTRNRHIIEQNLK